VLVLPVRLKGNKQLAVPRFDRASNSEKPDCHLNRGSDKFEAVVDLNLFPGRAEEFPTRREHDE